MLPTLETVDAVELDAALLPRVSLDSARLARLCSDRRLAPWLRSRLGDGIREAGQAHDAARGVGMDLAFDGGCFTVCIEAAALPALRMVAALEDRPLACDAAGVLLESPLSRIRPELPGLRVQGLRTPACATGSQASEWALPHWRHEFGRATLTALDAEAALSLGDVLARCLRAPKGHLRGLRIPGRARLFNRVLTAAQWQSLESGDVFVWPSSASGADALPTTCLSFGWGSIMHADAQLDADSPHITLTQAPRLGDDSPADAAGEELNALSELALPISFEIDTARISIEELSALDAGSVVPLEVPLRGATIRLVCHGQVVGNGQLVAVGERLGVRITRMGMRSVGAAGQGA